MIRRILNTTASAAALSVGLAAAAAAQTTLNGGGSTLAQPTYDQAFTQFSNNDPNILFSYDGVGSGAGQTAFLTNNISLFNNASTQYGTIVGSTVHFGASDAFLTSSQVSGYSLESTDGPLIQIPTVGVAVAIPYNNSNLTKGLVLTDDQLCGVISGQLTTWNKISSQGTASQQIHVVYRTDGSGTTFLLTQHLNAVCTNSNSNFSSYPVLITKTFAQLFPSGFPAGSSFTGANGSSGVASTLQSTSLSLGYLSPDYTSLAPMSPNATSLLVASLVNPTSGTAYKPTVKNTTLGLESPGPTSTDQNPPATKTAAANPLNWVPSLPTTTDGYNIVGYTTWDLSSCYASKMAGSGMINFLSAFLNDSTYATIITNNGFVPVVNSKASKFVTAINNDFLSNKSKYNLDIDDKNVCASTNKKGKGFAGR